MFLLLNFCFLIEPILYKTTKTALLLLTSSNTLTRRFYQKYIELRARIKANSCPVLPASPISNNVVEGDKESAVKATTNFIIQRSASLKDHRNQLR